MKAGALVMVTVGDGGGKAPALRNPLKGADRVARFVIGLVRIGTQLGARAEPALVNGQPGARYLTADGLLINVVTLDIYPDGIRAIRSVVNPDKLAHLDQMADATALLGRAGGERN